MKYLLVIAAALGATAAQAQSFKGPWIEARGGWDHVSEAGTSESGFLYGAAAGYDLAVGGKAFLGLQAGISGSTLDYCDLGVCTKAGRDIEALARAGFAVADRTALYALGGHTHGRINFSAAGLSGGVNVNGFRLGAGVEQQFGSKTYTKLEYRYTNYGDATLAGFNLGDAGDRHQVSASFGIRF
jgi:outer membrane immunogenic protein